MQLLQSRQLTRRSARAQRARLADIAPELAPIERVKINRTTDRASRANPHISRSAARRARAACSCSWAQENVAYFVQSLERRSYIGAYPPPKASPQEHRGKEAAADRVNGGGGEPSTVEVVLSVLT